MKKRSLIAGALALIAFESGIGAQGVEPRLDVPTTELESRDHMVRMRAFYRMVAAAHGGKGAAGRTAGLLAQRAKEQDDLARALIALLERENAFVASAAPQDLTEDFAGGYHVDLMLTVAGMRDPRSLNALLPVIDERARAGQVKRERDVAEWRSVYSVLVGWTTS